MDAKELEEEFIEYKIFESRKGKIEFDIFDVLRERELRALFSVFYPMAINDNHEYGIYSRKIYYGISPKFDTVKEGDMIPEYTIVFDRKDGEVIVEFNKLK